MKRFLVYAALMIAAALGTTVLVTSALAQEVTETPTAEGTSEATTEPTGESTAEGSETPANDPTADAAFNQTNQPADTTATPEATDAAEPTRAPALDIDLETITADPSLFVGQTVTMEGVVENLVNVRAFVLGEAAALDNDQILVINTSGEEFDIRVTDGARFRVTGVVYNSFADGGLTQLVAAAAAAGDLDMATEEAMSMDGTATPMMADATAEATEESGVLEPMVIPYTTSIADMSIPDSLFNYTIIQITSIDDLLFVELPQ